MIEKFEYKGYWWLPNRPQTKISGTLTFNPDEGAILDLEGSFKDIGDLNRLLRPEVILGASLDGKNITLLNCVETKTKLYVPGYLTMSFFAVVVLVGAHFQRADIIKFKKLSIHYSYLDEWVNISGFNIQRRSQTQTQVEYKLPRPIQITGGDDYEISINFRAKPYFAMPKKVSIEQKAFINIEFSEERSFDEYLNLMDHIRNFLSLGVTEPVYPLAIEGITELNKEVIKDKVYYPPVKIFAEQPDIPTTLRILHPSNMLFTFNDISDKFGMLLKNWFKKADLLEPVYSLYFGTLYNPRMYPEHRFLSLIQAIESFHQRVHGGKYLSDDDDYGRIRDVLVNAIPNDVMRDFRESLKNKIKYGNEYSLGKRLKEIFVKYQENLKFIENKDIFIRKIVDTRNYLTHYDKELREQSASGEALYHLTQKLKMVMEICLLSELGFSSSEIKGLFAYFKTINKE